MSAMREKMPILGAVRDSERLSDCLWVIPSDMSWKALETVERGVS